MQKFKARHNRTPTLRLWSCLFTRNLDQNEKRRVFFTSGQKKINCFIMDAYCDHCKTVFEAMGCYYHFCSCQIARPSSTDQDIEQGNKKREVDEMRREHIQEKGYKVEEMWEYGLWESLKTNDKIKNHVRTLFPYKRLPIYRLPFGKKKIGLFLAMFRAIYNLALPDELKSKFSSFSPIFKNIEIGRNDAGDYMKNYAIENEMLKHPQRMLISSFKLENGTVITPLFNFHLEVGLQCTKIYRFVQYAPRNGFNNFVQSVIDARREGDENALSGVVAETMKLLGNSSYGYQIMDRSRHTITKYLNDEKTHRAINEPLFKRLNTVEKDLFVVEVLNTTIEHREPIIVGFFILQYAKLRMLELYYNFFDKFCDVNKYEELEINTD